MTPPHTSPRNAFARARNVVLLGGLALAMLAIPASAQGLGLPALPDIDQQVTTPLGTAQARAANGDACIRGSLATPGLPVPLPVAVPQAGADVKACAHADVPAVPDLPVDAQQAAGQAVGTATSAAEAAQGEASSLLDTILGFFRSLF